MFRESKLVHKYSFCGESKTESSDIKNEEGQLVNVTFSYGCAFSNSGKFFAAFSNSKDVLVWQTGGDWKQIGLRSVSIFSCQLLCQILFSLPWSLECGMKVIGFLSLYSSCSPLHSPYPHLPIRPHLLYLGDLFPPTHVHPGLSRGRGNGVISLGAVTIPVHKDNCSIRGPYGCVIET